MLRDFFPHEMTQIEITIGEEMNSLPLHIGCVLDGISSSHLSMKASGPLFYNQQRGRWIQ